MAMVTEWGDLPSVWVVRPMDLELDGMKKAEAY